MEHKAPKKVAVALFNLGGPDGPAAVRPFLRNLFSDPAIIALPNPFRKLLANFIAKKREPEAQDIYEKIGGRSPILPNTREQASALEQTLSRSMPEQAIRVFVSMRYWHPFSAAVVQEVKKFEPDEVLLLPLYPQFSTTTTESSFSDWVESARAAGLSVPTKKLCCYPVQEAFIDAHATLLLAEYEAAKERTGETPRVLFTAHGLPKKIIDKGDPYQWQVELTAHAIVEKMNIAGLDYSICYQSRVGPMEWIGPHTDAEIIRAARQKKPIVITPIAFVSDHSETLVELDIQYRQLAIDNGLPEVAYTRVAALNSHPIFIEALAQICRGMLVRRTYMDSCAEKKICPSGMDGCLYHKTREENLA